MNWKQINKDYPKAFKKFVKWLDCDSSDMLKFEMMMILKNERDLYDFFDEQKVYINVFITEHPDKGNTYWDWELFVDGECLGSSEVEEPTRKEAETAAFNEAFNQLEKQ